MSNLLQTLEYANRGELIELAEAETRSVIAGLRQNGGTGKLSIELTFKSLGEGRVEVAGRVVAKHPRAQLASSIFYVNDENELQRNDPKQTRLFDSAG